MPRCSPSVGSTDAGPSVTAAMQTSTPGVAHSRIHVSCLCGVSRVKCSVYAAYGVCGLPRPSGPCRAVPAGAARHVALRGVSLPSLGHARLVARVCRWALCKHSGLGTGTWAAGPSGRGRGSRPSVSKAVGEHRRRQPGGSPRNLEGSWSKRLINSTSDSSQSQKEFGRVRRITTTRS